MRFGPEFETELAVRGPRIATERRGKWKSCTHRWLALRVSLVTAVTIADRRPAGRLAGRAPHAGAVYLSAKTPPPTAAGGQRRPQLATVYLAEAHQRAASGVQYCGRRPQWTEIDD